MFGNMVTAHMVVNKYPSTLLISNIITLYKIVSTWGKLVLLLWTLWRRPEILRLTFFPLNLEVMLSRC